MNCIEEKIERLEKEVKILEKELDDGFGNVIMNKYNESDFWDYVQIKAKLSLAREFQAERQKEYEAIEKKLKHMQTGKIVNDMCKGWNNACEKAIEEIKKFRKKELKK